MENRKLTYLSEIIASARIAAAKTLPETADSAAAPAASCMNWRRGSVIALPPKVFECRGGRVAPKFQFILFF
jgi:hypothetical protein